MFNLELQIDLWKRHLEKADSIQKDDVDELESHLRDSIDELVGKGLVTEEAFLIAVRRLGDVDMINEEFSKVSTEDVWKQLFIPSSNRTSASKGRGEVLVVIGLALLGGLLGKLPAIFGYGDFDAFGLIYARNASLFALFPVAIYYVWRRSLPFFQSIAMLCLFGLAALVVNGYPSFEPHHTGILSAIHVPIISILLLLYFYGDWKNTNTRLNYIRFLGESFIFTVLIGLGGVVLIVLTMGTFELVGIDASRFVQFWMAPLGFFGIFPIAAYLVQQKKSLIESIAPVLARIFTPLFLIIMVALIVVFIIKPHDAFENRALLIWFDVILALVLALTLYSMSSKDYRSTANPTIWDVFSFVLLAAAVIVDIIALAGILTRLSAFGFSPNKSAALGENIILLANLLLLSIGYARFLIQKSAFQTIVEMQMRFLPIYAIWAAVVVVLFPLIFGFH